MATKELLERLMALAPPFTRSTPPPRSARSPLWPLRRSRPAAPIPSEPPPPPVVTVAHPPAKNITDWDEYTGRIEPVEAVEVRARVSGYLQSIHFDEGGMIEEGDLLFVIDPRPYRAVLQQAAAELTRARVAARARGQRPRARRTLFAVASDFRGGARRAHAGGARGRSGARSGGSRGARRAAQRRVHGGQGADRRADRPIARDARQSRQRRDRRLHAADDARLRGPCVRRLHRRRAGIPRSTRG